MAMLDAHRLFVQALMAERICDEDRAKQLMRRAVTATEANVDRDLTRFVDVINMQLQTVDLRLQFGETHISGDRYLALVNTEGDEIAQLATEYNAAEIAFFKRVVDVIVTATPEPFVMNSMKVLSEGHKAAGEVTRMSMADGQKLLKGMVENMWLENIEGTDGLMTLGLRSLLELKTYLKEGYPDNVFDCVCLSIVGLGESCPNEECMTRMHIRCSRRYFQNGQPKCPTCGTEWKLSEYAAAAPARPQRNNTAAAADEGGAAASSSTTRGSSAASSQPRTSKRQKQSSRVVDDEAGDDDEEEEERAPVRSSSRRRS